MKSYFVKKVNILDVNKHCAYRGSSVEVKNGKIASIGKAPDGCEVIDGHNGWLIPGLFDMHANFYTPGPNPYTGPSTTHYISSLDASLPLYLSYGVTTIMSKNEEDPARIFDTRDAINRGERVGPRILTAGLIMNRTPKLLPTHLAAETVDEMMNAYFAQRDRIDLVKVYIFMTPDWLKILADQAHQDGLKVYGHIDAMTAYDAVSAGIDGLEHGIAYMPEFRSSAEVQAIPSSTPKCIFSNYANFDPNSDTAKRLLELYLEKDTALTPTASCLETFNDPSMVSFLGDRHVWDYYSDDLRDLLRSRYEAQMNSDTTRNALSYFQDLMARQCEFLSRFHRGGGRLFAGTDPSVLGVFGGTTLAREAVNLQRFGMTPFEVLEAMTVQSAKECRLSGITGAIEVGMEADMVLLNSNPLMDLMALEDIDTVFKSGELYSPQALRSEAKSKIINKA